jgi:hypothetical protein
VKLIEIKNINESRNTKIEDLTWNKQPNRLECKFIDSRGDTYEIRLVDMSSYTTNNPKIYGSLEKAIIYDIQFSILKNGIRDIKMTDKDNGMEVLSIVQNAAFDKFKADNIVPDVISLTASSLPEDNTTDQFTKRKRAYNIIANRLHKELLPPYNYPNVYPNIVGKYGTAVLLSKIDLSAVELQKISSILQSKL